jgi:oligopeptide transport system substrate-binding protein
LYFNFSKPPFNNVLVRQAFAAAIDREALVKIAQKYGATNPKPATSFTPSETLGRDLYNEVGIPFNPTKAKELLAQAGYTDASNFPTPTLLISNAVTNVPGFHVKITEAITDMWQQNLGVKVTFQVLEIGAYFNRIDSDPTELFRLISIAENNDPSDFLETFKTGAEYNYGGFSNSEFDKLINLATESNDPAKRQELYIQAERVLCETEAAIIPIYYSTYNIP